MAWLAPLPGRILTLNSFRGRRAGALAPGFILARLRRVKAKVYTRPFRLFQFMVDIQAQ